MKSEIIKEKDKDNLVAVYDKKDICLERGKGAICFSPEGKEYVDFSAGIGVNSLGFCDEGWKEAVKGQLDVMQHCSNLFYSEPSVAAAEILTRRTGMSRVFFGNSGAEANECAIKAVRKYGNRKKEGKNKIVTLINSFHGRTMATLTATGQEEYHKFFHPFVSGFSYAEAGNIKSLTGCIDENTCALMLEMIQGEGGVVPLDYQFVKDAERLCMENEMLLIVDEVQTGIGRTGKLFAYEHFGIKPDIVTFAKGIGNGLPIGGAIFAESCADVFEYGSHGTTFGGNPVACAGACHVLKRIDDSFMEEVTEKGKYLKDKLSAMKKVSGVSGLGLMIGIEIEGLTAQEAAAIAGEKGLLVLTAKKKLRLLPPLVITYEEMDKGLRILEEILN